MKALVLRDFWDFQVDERERKTPGPGEVTVRVFATGICGSDLHGYTGQNGRRVAGQVMGHETVGHIAELGAGVEGLAVGDVVTVNPVLACGNCPACAAGQEQACPDKTVIGVSAGYSSAFAEYFLAPARNLVRLPETMPIEYGALVEPLAVAYHAANRGGCGGADAVLVLGGGPIGQSAILAARMLGATAIAVSEPDPARRRLCAELGATPLDPAEGDLAAGTVTALGRKADLVLDAVGTSATIADAFSCSVFGARVVLVGMNAPQLELPAYSVSTEERSLIGSFCYTARHFREVADWVATAPAELAALVEETVPVRDAPETFAGMARGSKAVAGKVLVSFQ
ncbi:zinc-dependent alcohol dehydrogenase [Sciscionella sediminilitoris]|uniref:zinc-dependent alcohol dehydrogenase n=1 Tax=Sciscionella sediminilitoris TaxID=1445613 RepID=UPI0004DF3667|nr:alcohol dehydrogenase catalytic domain-containing protein [Sciscionella sp. SE31]